MKIKTYLLFASRAYLLHFLSHVNGCTCRDCYPWTMIVISREDIEQKGGSPQHPMVVLTSIMVGFIVVMQKVGLAYKRVDMQGQGEGQLLAWILLLGPTPKEVWRERLIGCATWIRISHG